MNLKISFTLLMLAVLQGCSLAPKQTLQPEHVPALYTPPSVQTPASVGTTDPDRAIEQAGRESAVLAPEETATDEQPAPIELASLSPDMAVTATDIGSTITTATDANADADADADADNCALISAEIAEIDAGLGAPAVETPPATPPTIAQKTGRYFYDLGAQTVLGQLQVFIQTKRAIFNDNEKERRAAEALERGTTRRAYLMGYASAANCQVASQ